MWGMWRDTTATKERWRGEGTELAHVQLSITGGEHNTNEDATTEGHGNPESRLLTSPCLTTRNVGWWHKTKVDGSGDRG